MKNFIIGIAVYIAFTPVVIAVEKAYEHQVDRLVDVTLEATRQEVSKSLKSYAQNIAQSVIDRNIGFPSEAKDLLSTEILEFMLIELFENPTLKKVQYEIYREHFNLAEIEELVTFYESSLGKKMLTEFSVITQKIQERAPIAVEGMDEKLINNLSFLVDKVKSENGWQ